MNALSTTLARLIAQSGKSLNQVSRLSGVDAAYLRKLLSGEKNNPSTETLLRLWIGIGLDANVVKRYPTFAHGLAELLTAASVESANRL